MHVDVSSCFNDLMLCMIVSCDYIIHDKCGGHSFSYLYIDIYIYRHDLL